MIDPKSNFQNNAAFQDLQRLVNQKTGGSVSRSESEVPTPDGNNTDAPAATEAQGTSQDATNEVRNLQTFNFGQGDVTLCSYHPEDGPGEIFQCTANPEDGPGQLEQCSYIPDEIPDFPDLPEIPDNERPEPEFPDIPHFPEGDIYQCVAHPEDNDPGQIFQCVARPGDNDPANIYQCVARIDPET